MSSPITRAPAPTSTRSAEAMVLSLSGQCPCSRMSSSVTSTITILETGSAEREAWRTYWS
jgi:hypothetical protein